MHRIHNESPHARAPLEWWYVNGCMAGDGHPPAHFFVALFRHRVLLDGTRAPGWELITACLDEATSRHSATVCINEALQRGRVEDISDLPPNTDMRLLACAQDEVARHGPIEPVTRRDDPVHCASDTMNIEWGDTALRQTPRSFRLRFTRPGTGEPCDVTLRLQAPRLDILPKHATRPSPMHYVSYPRLALTGTCGGAAVTGSAWLDHQWGHYGFFWHKTKRQRRAVASDWVGAALDDGSEIVAFCVRDAQRGNRRVPGLLVRTPSGKVITSERVRFDCLGEWTSPATGIVHRNSWRIRAKELAADLVFRPLAAGQEAVGFFLSHGLWEGAGRLEGTLYGRPVSGRAFGEAQGNGYVYDLESTLMARVATVDRHIEQVLPRTMTAPDAERLLGPTVAAYDCAAGSAMLHEPVWDLLGRSGKRWRPLFGTLLLGALGGDPSPYEELVSAVSELPHTGSLIIDDIEDNSLLRRGGPTLHVKYGLDLAINAGNTLYFLPLTLLKDHPALTPAQRLEAHELLVQHFVRAHMGQSLDLYWSRSLSRPRLEEWLGDSMDRQILDMYALKTGSPVEGLAEMASVIAGRGREVRIACAGFARALAVAFQIVDDVHNFSGPPKWRKTPGEDLAEGKPTYVIMTALRLLDGARRERLAAILCDPARRRRPQALQSGIALVRESGALDACREEARTMLRDAWRTLCPSLRMNTSRVMLRALCEHLVDHILET